MRPLETFAKVNVLRDRRRVEVLRTAEPFETEEELTRFWSGLQELVADTDVSDWDVLTDLRQALGRSDETFERAMARARKPFYDAFHRSAVVVRSSVGRMHVVRHTAKDVPQTQVFDSLAAARAWLDEPG